MKKVLLLFSLNIFLIFTVFAGDPDLFYFVSDTDDHLYSVDRVSGVVTDIGANGVSNIEAIAYYPIPGANQLFAADGGEFGELNLSTGVYTAISDIDAAGPMNGALGAQNITDVDAMMVDGQTFIIWAAQRNSPNDLLFQIDPTTGLIIRSAFGPGIDYIVVSGPGISVDVDDLAVSPKTGRMYASNNDGGSSDNLIEINKYNATYAIIAPLSEDDIEGLAFHNDGTLYGSEGDINRFSEVNITTGAMTNQITLAGGDIEAFAALVADANTVSGTVYNDDDLDAVLDGGETGVEGVVVYLYIDNDADGQIDPEDTRIQTTTTDSNGDYIFYYASTANLLVTTEFSSYPASSALTTDNLESAIFTDNVNFAEVDANNNFGIGTGPDCDGDGLPNFFEGGNNSDADAVLDSCDLDSDNDGILDSVEGIQDFDGDGIPNYRDRDSDDDGIPDAIEANRGSEPTGYSASNGNISGADIDGNGIIDAIETSSGSGVMTAPLPDSDKDGKLDYLDLDSDNDGILDIIEAGGEDSDSDGQVDGLLDANSNGLDDRIEATPLAITNTDAAFETTNSLTLLPNYIDIDSDSDGIDDTREGYSTADYGFPTLLTDTDGDGIVDFWDVSTFSAPIIPFDRDADGTPDYIDDDSDNDGVSDLIEGNDADGDGVVDVVLSGIDDDENGLDDALDELCGQSTFYAPASGFAEEDLADGSVSTGSGDLELVNDGSENQLVGLRFSDIEINQGEDISSAYVQFEVDAISSGELTIVIQGELDTDAGAFSTTTDDVSDRTRTAATLTWKPQDWTVVNENGVAQRTVNIASIIQEIVDQGGWANGNDLVLIFSGPTGNSRVATTDPLLIISTEFDETPTLSFTAGDYGEEDNGDGSVDVGSSDLELPNDGSDNQMVGVLFSGVNLSQGQIITSAYIQFQADEDRGGAVNLSIEGELAESAATYTGGGAGTNDISTRSTTVATPVAWSPADWIEDDEGVVQRTPDLTNIVQEIVNQGGWTNGNNMAFIITGTAVSGTDRRTAETDPILVIETTASFSICASGVAHQDFDNDGEDDFRDTDDDADGISTISEIPDANSSGTPDYLEFGGDECGLGFLRTGYTNDYTGVQESENSTVNPANFTGTPNTGVTRFDSNNDEYIIDFEQVYPAGYKYVITWSRSEAGTAEIVLSESDDNSVFNGRLDNPTTSSATLFNDTITSLYDFQYIKFRLEDGISSIDFEIDAVGVLVPTCEPDADDDGIVNSVDIDDDNDGVLDSDEGCSTDPAVVYATYESDLNDVVDDVEAAGAPDGLFAQIYDNSEQLILDFGSIYPVGTQYFITWRRRNTVTSGTATIDLSESELAASGFTAHPTSPNNTDNVNFTTTTVTSNSSFRYVAFDKGNSSSVDFEIDAVGVLVCADTDGDGIPDSFDLDSDNDGIPDILEAGGASSDVDSDGRVDDAEDTDGDGWADVFDPDDGGTILVDEDKDGDGFENRIDLDSDDDGLADIIEAGGVDVNNDGVGDISTDTDRDGWFNLFDSDDGGTVHPLPNTDGDVVANYLDLDSDNDGITDNVEWQTTLDYDAPSGVDANNNGWDDEYDGQSETISNNDGAGAVDYLSQDSDGDGAPDYVEGFDDGGIEGAATDDLKDRATAFETVSGNPNQYVNSDDGDSDGIPDWMEDADSDGVPNFLDPQSAFHYDVDNDGLIDLYDDDDVVTGGAASNLPDFNSDGEPDFRDTDNTVGALPIELIGFTATKVGSYVQLDWSTATEINNDYFTIERSIDGVQFEEILTEKGAGNSSTRNDYRRYDEEPELGYNYYKLTQTDFDGQSESFNIEVVKFDGITTIKNSEARTFSIYPNPTEGGELTLAIDQLEPGNLLLEIRTAEGRIISQQELRIEEDIISYKVEVLQGKRLAAGTYYLKVITDKKVKVLPFIVK